MRDDQQQSSFKSPGADDPDWSKAPLVEHWLDRSARISLAVASVVLFLILALLFYRTGVLP